MLISNCMLSVLRRLDGVDALRVTIGRMVGWQSCQVSLAISVKGVAEEYGPSLKSSVGLINLDFNM